MQECNELLISQNIKNLSIKVDLNSKGHITESTFCASSSPNLIVVKYWKMPSVAVCILGTDDRFWRSAVVKLLLTHKYAQYVCPAIDGPYYFFLYIWHCGTKLHIRGAQGMVKVSVREMCLNNSSQKWVPFTPCKKRTRYNSSRFCPRWGRYSSTRRCPWSYKQPCGSPPPPACQRLAPGNYTSGNTETCISLGVCRGLCSRSESPRKLLWRETFFRTLWFSPPVEIWRPVGCLVLWYRSPCTRLLCSRFFSRPETVSEGRCWRYWCLRAQPPPGRSGTPPRW